jgi:putative redox protein
MSSSEEAPAAAAPKPLIKNVTLRWSGEGLRFDGGPEGVPPSVIDPGSKAGPSPTDHLLLAAAGCMGADVIDILGKSRVPIESFTVQVEGRRAEKPPRRFTSIAMSFHIRGPTSADRPKVERAVNLSRETYCSVLHTLRPDLDLVFEVHLD